MENFDFKKYLAEGKLLQEETNITDKSKSTTNEGLLNNFSDYDTVYEIARHKLIPLAMVGMILVKYGVKKAIELVKGGKEEVMNAIEDSPKQDLDTTPPKQGIKLFKKKDNSAFKKFLDNMDK